MGNEKRPDKDTRKVSLDELENVVGGTGIVSIVDPLLKIKQTLPEEDNTKKCHPGQY